MTAQVELERAPGRGIGIKHLMPCVGAIVGWRC